MMRDSPMRYELKYLVPEALLPELRQAIQPFVRADMYAGQGHDIPEYTVRSIYFDNHRKDAIHTKIEGLNDRKKLRIRTYNKREQDGIVFLEIKRKLADRISKDRARIWHRHLEKMMESKEFEPYMVANDHIEIDSASRFFFNLIKFQMNPVNLIVYEWEPYHGIFNPDLRITFDKNIRSKIHPQINELYEENDFVFPWKSHFIMEIKYTQAPMTSWLKQIILNFELKNAALSKYVEGYLCHPYHSIS
jgi:hypothetical protein